MIGLTAGSLYRNIILPMIELFGNNIIKYKSSLNRVYIAGVEIHCLGANDSRSEHFVRGATVIGILGDEITLWNKTLFGRCFDRLSVPGAQGFYTTNPDSPNHWLMKEWFNDEDKSQYISHFTFKLRDNEWLVKNNLPYIVSLEKAFKGVWKKRYIDGLWAVAEGLVYDFWDDDTHLIKPGEPKITYENFYISNDYGSKNPFVYLLWGENYNGYTGESTYDCLDEYYYCGRDKGKIKTNSQYVDELDKFIDKNTKRYGIRYDPQIIPDPSETAFITEMRRRGYRVKPANNDVKNGITNFTNLMVHEYLRVHPRCKKLREEFSLYMWDEKKSDKGIEEPLKENDHCMDSARYFTNTVIGFDKVYNLRKIANKY